MVAGAAVAWRRFATLDQPDSAASEQLWQQRFDTPEGADFSMSIFKGKPLVLNFWATWCPPCIEELPMLDEFYRANSERGWQVLGLAVDQPAAVRRFLSRAPVSFPVGLAGFDGAAWSRSLGNDAGGLPFTVVFDANGRLRERKMGQLSSSDLVRWAGSH